MDYVYDIMTEVDLEAFEPASKVFETINKCMASFDPSFPKVGATSTISVGTLTVSKPLSNKDKDIVIGVMWEQFSKDPVLSKNFKIIDLKLV